MIEPETHDMVADEFDSLRREFDDFSSEETVFDASASEAAPTPAKQGLEDSLADVLAELTGMECEAGASADKPMSAAPTEVGAGEVAEADHDTVEVESEAAGVLASPSGEFKSRGSAPRVRWQGRKLLLGLVGTAVLAATNGMSYFLGTLSQSHHPPTSGHSGKHVVAATAPVVQGLDRYVGQTSTSKIDGKTIFESEEVKLAIEELDGGMELQQELIDKSRKFVSDEPIYRSGGTIQVRSCSKLDCERDSIRLEYDVNSKKVAVCLTKPYGAATTISYAFNQLGFQERGDCEGNLFPKAPKPRRDE